MLLHEQGHHDIIGLIARDLCRKLLSISLSSDIVDILRDAGDTPRARLAYVRRDFAEQADSAGQAATAIKNWLENSSTGPTPAGSPMDMAIIGLLPTIRKLPYYPVLAEGAPVMLS